MVGTCPRGHNRAHDNPATPLALGLNPEKPRTAWPCANARTSVAERLPGGHARWAVDGALLRRVDTNSKGIQA